MFVSMTPMKDEMRTATGEAAEAIGIEQVEVLAMVNGSPDLVTINDVMCIPSFTCSLLSLSTLAKKGDEITMNNGQLKIVKDRKMKAVAILKGSLYVMDFEPVHHSFMVREQPPNLMTYHRRLGHVNLERVAKAVQWKGSIPKGVFCEGCTYGKAHRKPFIRDLKKREETVGALIHADLCGPMEVTSLGGSRYFLLIKDDYSSLMFVYFLPNKAAGSILESFKTFLVDWNRFTGGRKIKRLRTDNGTEFVNTQIDQWLEGKVISHETSVPYTPEQNGLIERSIRTVQESAKSMIFDNDLPIFLWSEAVNTAVNILNKVPCVSSEKSPYELVTGRKPDLSSFRVFGSKSFVHIRDGERRKWDKKAKKMLLVGYNEGSRSYRLFDPEGRKIVCSRDVTIIEESKDKQVNTPVQINQETSLGYGSDCMDTESDDEPSSVSVGDVSLRIPFVCPGTPTQNDIQQPVVTGVMAQAPTQEPDRGSLKRRTRTSDGTIERVDSSKYRNSRQYSRRNKPLETVPEDELTELMNLCFMVTDEPSQ